MSVVHEFGGAYSDVDDIYADQTTDDMSRLGNTPLFADEDQVLTLGPTYAPWEKPGSVEGLMINNSSFAAHAGSGILRDMMQEGVARYKAPEQRGLFPDPMGMPGIGLNLIWNKTIDERLRMLSRMIGPGLFTDAVSRSDQEFGELFNDLKAVVARTKPFTFKKQMSRNMPLHRFITSGAAQTWRS
jgi:insecticidal toxin complex protein TccC